MQYKDQVSPSQSGGMRAFCQVNRKRQLRRWMMAQGAGRRGHEEIWWLEQIE
jgi:hypothetical protein